VLLSQAAYRGGLGAPLATATLVNPATAAAIGLLLAGDQFRGGATGALIALAAAAVAARGVVLLVLPSEHVAAQPAPAPSPVPAPEDTDLHDRDVNALLDSLRVPAHAHS
jgi:hypothetical protein